MVEPFEFGWPEAKAVAIAVVIIVTWAVIRYGWAARRDPSRGRSGRPAPERRQ